MKLRTLYNKVSKYYTSCYGLNRTNTCSLYNKLNNLIETCDLLLKIIDIKTDDEFNIFYKIYMSNFELKQYYYYKISNDDNISFVYKKFNDATDFIDKFCASCIMLDVEFYEELKPFLKNLVIIDQIFKKEFLEVLKKEKQKKEEIEILNLLEKEEKQEKLKVIELEEENLLILLKNKQEEKAEILKFL